MNYSIKRSMTDKIVEKGDIKSVMIIAGHPRSLITFRGPFLQALVSKGIDVHAAAPELLCNDRLCTLLTGWGVTPHDIRLGRTGVSPVEDVRTTCALYSLLRNVRPDAVFGYTIKPVIYGSLAGWLARVPRRFAMITGLGYAFTGEASGKRRLIQHFARTLYKVALQRCHRVFYQNPDDQDLFRQLGLQSPNVPSTVVNGSGIDLVHFKSTPLPDGPASFLLIARLLGDKGVREYAAAARKIKQEYPEAIFRLVGNIDSNPDAIKQVELDFWVDEGIVEYLGRLDDVRPAIADSSVIVLPSYREGTPRSVLEGMAMGRAVITTDAPGCRETVKEGYNGFLVPVKSADQLAQAMRRFLTAPSLVSTMGMRSRQMAEDRYDVHKVNRSMFEGMGID